MVEYDRKWLNRIQSIKARFGVCVGVQEYNLECWRMPGVWEYDWSPGVLSKALQYQYIQMTFYSRRVQKFFPVVNISIIIYFSQAFIQKIISVMKRRNRFLTNYICRIIQKLCFFIQTNYNPQKIHRI